MKTSKYKNVAWSKQTLSKVKPNKTAIRFPNFGNPKNVKIWAYDDVYASLKDGSSLDDRIIFIQGWGQEGGSNQLAMWKVDKVTKSPLASETLAVT